MSSCSAISTTIARGLRRANARVWKTDSRADTWSRAGLDSRIGAEHANSRAKFGPTERNHVLSDVLSNNLTMLRVGVRENVLDEIIAVLITGDIDQWNARTVETTLTDTIKIAAEKIDTTNLEALLDDLGSKLIHAILRGVADDMINGSATISWGTMLADVLDAPVAKLAVSNNVNACQNFLNARALEHCKLLPIGKNGSAYLVLLETVLKDILNDQATSLTKSNLVPHTTESFIDIFHDLRRGLSPTKLEKLLPDVTSVAMDDSLRDTTKKLMNHDGLIILWNRVKCLLNYVAAERIHGEVQGIASDRLSNLNNLFRSTMLEAALDQKITEPVNHQWICLSNDGLDDVILLLSGTNLELLLKEDRCLLIIVANNLVNNILPVAVDSAIKKTAIVERLSGWQVSLTLSSNHLFLCYWVRRNRQ